MNNKVVDIYEFQNLYGNKTERNIIEFLRQCEQIMLSMNKEPSYFREKEWINDNLEGIITEYCLLNNEEPKISFMQNVIDELDIINEYSSIENKCFDFIDTLISFKNNLDYIKNDYNSMNIMFDENCYEKVANL